jgi:hypothetical protein
MMREMIKADSLPDYTLEELPGDLIGVRRRRAKEPVVVLEQLSEDALAAARALVPGVDVYALEVQWHSEGGPRAKRGRADTAFLNWVRDVVKNGGV